MFINQNTEKAFQNRVLPPIPDFAARRRTIPANRRNVAVWKWPLNRGYTTNAETISKRISELGRLAQIRTGKDQCASADDLRRSFGSRLAMKIQPFALRALMRHVSVTTTELYDVGDEANHVADTLDQAAEDTGFEPATACAATQFQ
jgi:integrase